MRGVSVELDENSQGGSLETLAGGVQVPTEKRESGTKGGGSGPG